VTVEAHFQAFFALLQADATLNPYDGLVPTAPAARYSLVYFYVETPDGLQAPDAVNLTGDSDVIDAWAYIHSCGTTPASARAQSDRVRTAVLNRKLTIAGRGDCFPIRWREGQPPRRDEDVPGAPVFDQVDVYSWRSLPA
jgi:hypothetical protein